MGDEGEGSRGQRMRGWSRGWGELTFDISPLCPCSLVRQLWVVVLNTWAVPAGEGRRMGGILKGGKVREEGREVRGEGREVR